MNEKETGFHTMINLFVDSYSNVNKLRIITEQYLARTLIEKGCVILEPHEDMPYDQIRHSLDDYIQLRIVGEDIWVDVSDIDNITFSIACHQLNTAV